MRACLSVPLLSCSPGACSFFFTRRVLGPRVQALTHRGQYGIWQSLRIRRISPGAPGLTQFVLSSIRLASMEKSDSTGTFPRTPAQHPGQSAGKVTTFDLDLNTRSATITDRNTGVLDALIQLHKSPGPHLVGIRMNWIPMRFWRWLADATVYMLLSYRRPRTAIPRHGIPRTSRL